MPFRTCIEPRTISHLHATEQHKSIKQFTDTSSLGIYGVSCGQLGQFFSSSSYPHHNPLQQERNCDLHAKIRTLARTTIWPSQPCIGDIHWTNCVLNEGRSLFWKICGIRIVQHAGSSALSRGEVRILHRHQDHRFSPQWLRLQLTPCSPICNCWGQNRDPSLKWHETPETTGKRKPLEISLGGWKKMVELYLNDLDDSGTRNLVLLLIWRFCFHVAEMSLQKRTPAQIGKFSPDCRVALGTWLSCIAGSLSSW